MPPRTRNILPTIALTLAGIAGASFAVEVNRIVLRVNDEIVTLHDYEMRKNERIDAVSRANIPPERRQELLANVGEETMRSIFQELLLQSRARQLNMRISEEKILAALENVKNSYGIETEEAFTAALERSGLTREVLRQQLRDSLLLQEVIGREVHSRINLEEDDLRRYYQAHPEEFSLPRRLELREVVFLEESGLPADEIEALAAEFAASVGSGANVEQQLADLKERGVATQWIDIGWVSPGDLDPELEAAVWDLEPGAVSEPLEARGGLHVVQVVDRKEAEIQPFAAVQQEIEARETERIFGEEMEDYLTELETASYIVAQPPPEAAGFRSGGPRRRADPLARLGANVTDEASPPPPVDAAPAGDGADG